MKLLYKKNIYYFCTTILYLLIRFLCSIARYVFKKMLLLLIKVRNFIKNPSQIITEQNKLVNLISDKLNFSKNVQKFLLLLIEKRRIFFVNKIIEGFLRLCSQKRGEIKVSLISSKELSQTELNNISTDLSKSMGSTLKFDYKVDKELIGGLKLQLGSIMIDTSIRNKLKKYEQAMLEN